MFKQYAVTAFLSGERLLRYNSTVRGRIAARLVPLTSRVGEVFALKELAPTNAIRKGDDKPRHNYAAEN